MENVDTDRLITILREQDSVVCWEIASGVWGLKIIEPKEPQYTTLFGGSFHGMVVRFGKLSNFSAQIPNSIVLKNETYLKSEVEILGTLQIVYLHKSFTSMA